MLCMWIGPTLPVMQVLLLRLRQACIHPSLAQTGDKDGTAAEGDDQQSDRPDGGAPSAIVPIHRCLYKPSALGKMRCKLSQRQAVTGLHQALSHLAGTAAT